MKHFKPCKVMRTTYKLHNTVVIGRGKNLEVIIPVILKSNWFTKIDY